MTIKNTACIALCNRSELLPLPRRESAQIEAVNLSLADTQEKHMDTTNLDAREKTEFDMWVEKINAEIQRRDLPTGFTLKSDQAIPDRIIVALQLHYSRWDITPFYVESRQWDPYTNKTVGEMFKWFELVFKSKAQQDHP